MKILLADDHGLFVEGLQNLLQAGGYEVVGAASDGLEALQQARQLHPDLILMDVRMPNCSGLEATRLVQSELPEIQIVMLTTSAEEADLFEALKCGANGYLLKNLKPNELFSFLEGLERGEAALSRELSARLLDEFARQAARLDELANSTEATAVDGSREPAAATSAGNEPGDETPGQDLTARQRQILEMVAGGATYKEIGTALFVSENTVKYHMGEIIQRLHARNRAQVVTYALRNGLIKRKDGGTR